MKFNKDLNWNTEFDLTSVALHEFGHVFQLMRTKNGGSYLMDRPATQNFSSIDNYTKKGGGHIVSLSTSIQGTSDICSYDPPDLVNPQDCSLEVINVDNKEINIILYPNPVYDFLTFEFSSNNLIDNDGFIDLIDENGRKIKTFYFNNLKNSNIDIKDLANGIYFVSLYFKNQYFHLGKFIKI